MSKTFITLDDKYRTKITSGDHTWYSDESIESGGDGSGPDPTQMLRGALGACMAITARLYADRKGWPLEGIDITIDYERFSAKDYDDYEGDAQFVHEITEAVHLRGPLTDEQRERILEITTKCPVRRLIANPVFFVEEELALELEEQR